MKIMMADGKESTTVESPTYIVTAADRADAPKKGGITKKHVVIGVIVVVVTAIILAAILIGVNMFTQAQKDIVKFTLQFKGSDNQDVKQNVESDPNDNVVMTKVSKAGQDAYIVNDFNKGMQIVKMVNAEGQNCYVTALNKSLAMEPLHIAGPDSMNEKTNGMETFVITDDPVTDRSFLPKKAADMCKGISLYWVTRQCGKPAPDNSTDVSERNKRTIYYLTNTVYGMRGLGGCCKAYWACQVTMIEYIVGSYHVCNTYVRTGTCCGIIPYPYCMYYYTAYWRTPGLVC